MKKLIYILPEVSQTTHMKYNVEFVRSLARERGVDIFLIIERGELPESLAYDLGVRSLHFTGGGNFLVRLIKLIYFLITARLKGYKTVYVHYSFIGAITASFLPATTVFYWNCGLPWNYRRSFGREFFEKLTYSLIDYLVTGSESLIDGYADYYKISRTKIKVIPNWFDLAEVLRHRQQVNQDQIKKALQLPLDKKIILFVHKLVKRKGAHYLPAIAKNLPEDALLLVIGDGAERPVIQAELKNNNLLEQVKMLGWVENRLVKDYLSIADLFILPSEEEGFSRSLLEALAYNVPFVAFDVGGVRGMVPESDHGFIVPVGDIDLFNKKIAERLKLGGSVDYSDFVKQFDKQVVLSQYLNVIK